MLQHRINSRQIILSKLPLSTSPSLDRWDVFGLCLKRRSNKIESRQACRFEFSIAHQKTRAWEKTVQNDENAGPSRFNPFNPDDLAVLSIHAP